MKSTGILLVVIIWTSCVRSKNNGTFKLNNNLDTIHVIHQYGPLNEIVLYENNRPFKSVGLTDQGDTIKYPKLFLCKSTDSLVAFMPLNKHRQFSVFFHYDSVMAVGGLDPKFKIGPFKRTLKFKVTPEMYNDNRILEGALICWDSVANPYWVYPFYINLK